MASPQRYLTKSLFKGALDCPLKLRHALEGCPRSTDENDFVQMLAEGGYYFEAYVRAHLPGIDFSERKGPRESLSQQALELIAKGDCVLHEATFVHEALSARCDTIRVAGDTVTVLEIKSRSSRSRGENGEDTDNPMPIVSAKTGKVAAEWLPYVADLAFQVHVVRHALEAAGIRKTVRAGFILPDKSKVAGPEDVFSKFRHEERVDAEAKALEPKSVWGRPAITYLGKPDPKTCLFMETPADDAVSLLEAGFTAGGADTLKASINDRIAHLEASMKGIQPWPEPPIGAACKNCEYWVDTAKTPSGKTSGAAWCWKGRKLHEPNNLMTLYYFSSVAGTKANRDRIDALLRSKADALPSVTEFPEELLSDKGRGIQHRRQIEAVRTGKTFVSPELRADPDAVLRSKAEHYPLFFFDYEGIRTLIPLSQGRRPYAQTAFQWSCHVIDRPGATIRHEEFLDFDNDDPTQGCLQSLRRVIGDKGTVYHWANYEVTVTREITLELKSRNPTDKAVQDLVAWSERTFGVKEDKSNPDAPKASARIVDLLKVAQEHYYHPEMNGRFSIKTVLPVIWKDPEAKKLFPKYERMEDGTPAADPYDTLLLNTKRRPELAHLPADRFSELRNGTEAMMTYMKCRFGQESSDPALKAIYNGAILEYCELDTAAMVMIWNHWRNFSNHTKNENLAC